MQRHRFALATAATLVALTLTACGDDDSAAQGDGGNDSGMSGMDHAAMAAAGDGLKAELDGYTLTALDAPEDAEKQGELSFRIDGPSGDVHKEFVRELGKLMHVYVVREDLTQYHHIHPEMDTKTGEWSIPITFAEPGPYRVVTEFEALTPEGEFDPRRLGKEIEVAGDYEPVPFEGDFDGTENGAYDLVFSGETKMGSQMTLTVTREGEEVTDLQQYLESFAHVTGFRKSDLKTVHMHPNEAPNLEDPNSTGGPKLTFTAPFTEPGTYRLFVQIKTDGEVRTTPMDVEVT